MPLRDVFEDKRVSLYGNEFGFKSFDSILKWNYTLELFIRYGFWVARFNWYNNIMTYNAYVMMAKGSPWDVYG